MDEQGTRAEGLVPVNDDKGMAASATSPVECAAGSDFAATIESTVRDVEARWGNTLRLLETRDVVAGACGSSVVLRWAGRGAVLCCRVNP